MDVVRAEMVKAMKSGEKERKEALSMLLAALKAKYIDKREDLTEEEENAVVLKEIKQTKETMDTAPADRDDIRGQCAFRMAVLQEFAPQSTYDALLAALPQGARAGLGPPPPSRKNRGGVMQGLSPAGRGKGAPALVNRLVTQRLTEG